MNLPNIDEVYKEIAEWITEYGLEGTTTGNYIIYFETIAKEFHTPVGWVKEHAEDIESWFNFDVVAECIIDDECFDMMFYLQYCCEHCAVYNDGNRCYDECSSCDCWDDNFEDEE